MTAGDFSDVKIVTPTGEIPYLEASRISDPEMKAWMIEVTNRVFTFLSFPDQPIPSDSDSRRLSG